MAVLGEKIGGGPTDHSAGLGFVSGALFLGSSWVPPTLLVAYERLPRMGITHRKRTWTGVRSVRVMFVEFSPTGCTSIRIAATLRYE
jgi:hypothetical protein